MKSTVSLTLLAAILAFAGQAHAQDAVPKFSLTGTGGVMAYSLPNFDTGFFGHSAGGGMVGGMLGLNATTQLGHYYDYDWAVGLAAFGAWGTSGTTSFTDTITAPGTIVVTGLSAPTGAGDSITIATSASNASSAIVENYPQGGNTTGTITASGGGATNNVGGVAPAPSGPGFVLGAAATSTTTGAGYGAIADTSGGVFVGAGDINGLVATTTTSRSLGYGGADLTIGATGHTDATTAVQVYGGPSFRLLGQTNTTDVTIDIPEVPPSVVTFPQFKINTVQKLDSTYWGGILGSSISIASNPGVVFTFGAEGGVYNVSTHYTGQNTYSTCCGNFVTSSPLQPTPGTSPNLSVTSTPNTFDLASTMAFAARANASATWAIDATKQVSIGANVEYLSKVATISNAALTTITPGGTSAAWTPSNNPAGPTFGWGSMANFGLTASFTGNF